jgi:hypothetical protein
MGMFATIGGAVMAIAAVSLVALAMDSALRNGGEGILLGLGLAAIATVPAVICASLFGADGVDVAMWTVWYCAALVAGLLVFGVVLMVHREQAGIICVGMALVLGAGIYAVAPHFTTAEKPAVRRAA